MGNKNSGPRSRPTRLKLLYGVTRQDRLNQNEPTPPPAPEEFDQPPTELDGNAIAIAEWSRVVPMLRRIGVISEAERSALIALCQQWARYIDAQEQIAVKGMVVEVDKGPIVNPYITVADKALVHCMKLWGELGLTPSGRSRLSALPAESGDKPISKWGGLLP